MLSMRLSSYFAGIAVMKHRYDTALIELDNYANQDIMNRVYRLRTVKAALTLLFVTRMYVIIL